MFESFEPTSPLTPVTHNEVDRVEAELGSRFPKGYREYVTRFGRGVIGGLVRVYAPADIVAGSTGVREWRNRIDEHWFWNTGPLTKARALECIILGDTVGGDELVFHPDAPDTIYVLAHDFDESYLAGDGLEAALAWFFKSGVLDVPFEDNTFEPF